VSERLLAYYGDDFTGSTDVLEVLAGAGIPTRLFVEPPSLEEVERHDPQLRAVGVAGSSRTMTPGEMDKALPAVFAQLERLGAQIVHYKVCSTFDSSPKLGSIGRAIEHGRAAFASRFVPLVVGAPRLGRYTVFGNLFARAGLDSAVFRLDRHPGMVEHPATPMHEADILRHLARQTRVRSGLVDVTEVSAGLARVRDSIGDRGSIVLIDLLHEDQLATVGELIFAERPAFVAGSSGVEDALVAHWSDIGLVAASRALPKLEPADRVLVVSGSASPVTDVQIGCAVSDGYRELIADTRKLVDGPEEERRRLVAEAVDALRSGASVVVHTARGSADPRIGETRTAVASGDTVVERVGRQLGLLLQQVHSAVAVDRTVVVGGDTSAYVARALGIVSLEAIARSAPGAPLCRADAPGCTADGMELILKGGQNGGRNYFREVRDGYTSAEQNGGS
jgi:3-oxoisoapionate kinase